MNIAKNLKYFFILPVVLSLLAIAAIAMWGLRPGIDLAGGSMLQVTYQPTADTTKPVRPPAEQVHAVVQQLNLGEIRIQPAGENGYILSQRDLSNEEKNNLVAVLSGFGPIHEDRYSSVGPVLGAELLKKGLIALGLVIVCIIIFIAFAFRQVSKPVASWKYGVVAIVTLLHDILVPAGLFAFLGFVDGARVDSLFIVGLLTILGISINDTIVVFDRIRENLKLNAQHSKHETFEHVVGKSISQTLSRSINTSLTVVIMLVALYFVGPVATKDFALTLIVGMVAGTYSSIFLASPLLVSWEKWSRRNA